MAPCKSFIPCYPIADIVQHKATVLQKEQASRQAHLVLQLSARSLDSYRSGSRFNSSQRQQLSRLSSDAFNHKTDRPKPERLKKDSSENSEGPRKRKIKLLSALIERKVASAETCSFLIRSSFICVNGIVETNEKASIDRYSDRIFVNNKDIGTVEYVTDHRDKWEQRAPRTHRDHRQSDIDAIHRNYSRDVDGGFFQSKKYKAGK